MDNDNIALAMGLEFAGAVGKQAANRIFNYVDYLFPYAGLRKRTIEMYEQGIKDSDKSLEEKAMALLNARKTIKELKEFENQATIAKIAVDAAKEGTDFGETSKVDEEWLSRFFDSAKHVSDEEAQALWGWVLADEFEKPGSYPKQLVRILAELPSRYAKVFANICALSVSAIYANAEGKPVSIEKYPFIIGVGDQYYRKTLDIDLDTLSELQFYGLIMLQPLSYNSRPGTNERFLYFHYGSLSVTIAQWGDNGIPIGNVMLSKAGESISRLISAHSMKKEISGHWERIIELLNINQVVFTTYPKLIIEYDSKGIESEWKVYKTSQEEAAITPAYSGSFPI